MLQDWRLCGHVAAGCQTVVSDSLFSPAVSDVEESEGLPSLDKPGWYSQGNWPHLHELLKTMTGKPEPKVGQPPRAVYYWSERWNLRPDNISGSLWGWLQLWFLAEAERDVGLAINQLREIHTGVMERWNVAFGMAVDMCVSMLGVHWCNRPNRAASSPLTPHCKDNAAHS